LLELNRLYCIDNLELLRELPSESIDLIYCDILYNTGKKFNDFDDSLGTPQEAMDWYEPRLIEMKRVLRATGSIYLHCDFRLVHYLKVKMDEIFGLKNFQNEIIWCYNTQGYARKKYSSKHDNILFYSKSSKFTFNLEDIREENPSSSSIKRFQKEIDRNGYYIDYKSKKKVYKLKGSPPLSWFNLSVLPSGHNENTGYNTQKPKKLLERIIKASSNKGDVVADFFLGSGTTIEVAKELGRDYIGCDINPRAIEITQERLNNIQ